MGEKDDDDSENSWISDGPSPQLSVGSEIGKIPLNPQRPSRARSTQNPSPVIYVVPFVDLNFMIFHQGLRNMIDLNFLIFHQGPRDTKNQKI